MDLSVNQGIDRSDTPVVYSRMNFDFRIYDCRGRPSTRWECGNLSRTADAVAQEPTPLPVELSVVRWCKDGHIGVEFLQYSQGDRERVTNLIEPLLQNEMSAHLAHATLTLTAVGP